MALALQHFDHSASQSIGSVSEGKNTAWAVMMFLNAFFHFTYVYSQCIVFQMPYAIQNTDTGKHSILPLSPTPNHTRTLTLIRIQNKQLVPRLVNILLNQQNKTKKIHCV